MHIDFPSSLTGENIAQQWRRCGFEFRLGTRATANTEVTLTFFQEKKIGREADIALTFRSNFQIVKYTPYCKLVVKRTEVVTYHLTVTILQQIHKQRYQ